MRLLISLFCLLGLAGSAVSESEAVTAPPAAAVVEGPGAKASAEAAVKNCTVPYTPGAHICSLIIQSIGIKGGGPDAPAELVTNVAGPNPRCYHAPAPGTWPNVAGMTRRLLKSWRGDKPILLDSFFPDDKSQSCEWLLRDQLPCPATGGQGDPPCIFRPSQIPTDGRPQLEWRKPATSLSESCEDRKQDTQFCSAFIRGIQRVPDTDRWAVRFEKPGICVTIDPAEDHSGFKFWEAKLELARAAKDEHVQAVVLFAAAPQTPDGACPSLYQIDIQRKAQAVVASRATPGDAAARPALGERDTHADTD